MKNKVDYFIFAGIFPPPVARRHCFQRARVCLRIVT